MKLAIFTGLYKGERFYDCFSGDDIEGNQADYVRDARYDYEITESEISARIGALLDDPGNFQNCLRGVSQSDLNRFVYKCYRGELERELIVDAVESAAREMVLDLWEMDCIEDLESIYEELESI